MKEKKQNPNNNYNKFSKYSRYVVNEFDVNLDNVELYEETRTIIKVVYFDKELNDFKMLHMKDFFVLLSKNNEECRNFLFNTYTKEEKLKDKLAAYILDFKSRKSTYKYIKYDLDLSAEEPCIKIQDNTIVLTYNTLAGPSNYEELQKVLNVIKLKDIDKKEYEYYINTFIKEHFEELNDLLQFIVLFLFYTDKKSSFMNIISPSDFGKTDFFIDLIVKRLQYGMKTKHEILEYTPSPLSYKDFIRKGTLFIDEFKVFRQEFKTMTNELLLNPKGEKQVEVGLFSKLFFSKEKSKSFTGVVDSQIINRVLLIDKSKTNRTIPEFLKKTGLDGDKLKDYLTIYYYEYFNKYINEYKKLDYEERQKLLKKELDKLKEKYKIKNIETTEEYIKRVFYTYIANILNMMQQAGENELIYYMNNDEFRFKKEGNYIYISKFETFLKNILINENEDYYNNVKFSLGNDNILEVKERKKTRIKGVVKDVAVIKIDENYLKEVDVNFIDEKEKIINELQLRIQEQQEQQEQIEQLKLELEGKNNFIEHLKNEIERIKKEKEIGGSFSNNNTNELYQNNNNNQEKTNTNTNNTNDLFTDIDEEIPF